MRIILADHHAQPRLALQVLLDEQPEFDLIGEAVNAQDLLLLAHALPADLIIVDRQLPGMDCETLIAGLHALAPRPIVIVMSSESGYSRSILKVGADAFVSKSDEPDWLLDRLEKYAKQVNQLEDANRKTKPA